MFMTCPNTLPPNTGTYDVRQRRASKPGKGHNKFSDLLLVMSLVNNTADKEPTVNKMVSLVLSFLDCATTYGAVRRQSDNPWTSCCSR
jgi:hypothetical protein